MANNGASAGPPVKGREALAPCGLAEAGSTPAAGPTGAATLVGTGTQVVEVVGAAVVGGWVVDVEVDVVEVEDDVVDDEEVVEELEVDDEDVVEEEDVVEGTAVVVDDVVEEGVVEVDVVELGKDVEVVTHEPDAATWSE